MKFLSSVLLVGTLKVFGGRLQADDEAAAIALRGSCDCAWTKKWSCPGFKKGSDGKAGNDNTVCYDYCCTGNTQQCLKCDKKDGLCEVTNNMTQCAKFKKEKNGLWRDEKTKQCLDMHEKNKFGLWKCKNDKKLENQKSVKVNGTDKYEFAYRKGKMYVDDASKGIRFQRKKGTCLVCDKSKKKCGKPDFSQGECSDFEKSNDNYKLTSGDAAGECLDRHLLGWGIYTCVKGNKNQIFSADDGKQCIKNIKRPPGKHCL